MNLKKWIFLGLILFANNIFIKNLFTYFSLIENTQIKLYAFVEKINTYPNSDPPAMKNKFSN